jgi:hypothetical protein
MAVTCAAVKTPVAESIDPIAASADHVTSAAVTCCPPASVTVAEKDRVSPLSRVTDFGLMEMEAAGPMPEPGPAPDEQPSASRAASETIATHSKLRTKHLLSYRFSGRWRGPSRTGSVGAMELHPREG